MSAAAGAHVDEAGDDVPDELENLGGSDERRADPQSQLAADVADQRRYRVLRALRGHEHLRTVAVMLWLKLLLWIDRCVSGCVAECLICNRGRLQVRISAWASSQLLLSLPQ